MTRSSLSPRPGEDRLHRRSEGPDWDGAIRRLRATRHALLCVHDKPDGDAIGSVLGLGFTLEAAGTQVTLACADPPSGALARLPGAERIVSDLSASYGAGRPAPWDLIVVMDSSGLDRLGALFSQNQGLFASLPIVNIDHHVTNDRFGATNVVDAGAASATEVLTALLERMQVTPDVAAATCLLAGMMTDSLSFQTESTTGRTLRAAASLVDAGAPLAALAYTFFRQRRRGSAVLWSKALSTLQFAVNGRIAWIEVTREMVEAAGEGAETGGLSGFAGSIEGVEIGFILEEGGDGNIYAGFRSQSVDVAAIAAHFGGGGHVRAAGCRFPAPTTLGEARSQLLPALERQLATAATG